MKIHEIKPENVTEVFEPRRVSKRKNTTRWCRGKKGVEHVPELRIDERHFVTKISHCHAWSYKVMGKDGLITDYPDWMCYHVSVCTNCEKVVDPQPECPDKPSEERNEHTEP